MNEEKYASQSLGESTGSNGKKERKKKYSITVGPNLARDLEPVLVDFKTMALNERRDINRANFLETLVLYGLGLYQQDEEKRKEITEYMRKYCFKPLMSA